MSNSLHSMADAKEALMSILPTLESNGGVSNHGAEARYQLRVVTLLIEMYGLKMNQIDVESKFVLNGGLDVALYADEFVGDFNVKDNRVEMIKNVRMLIEIKSLLVNGKDMRPGKSSTRLGAGTIIADIKKLFETQKYLADQGTNVAIALMVFDTTEHDLRITNGSLCKIIKSAEDNNVDFFYFTNEGMTSYINNSEHPE